MRGQEMRWTIIGGSGGIGASIASYAVQQGDAVWCTAGSFRSARKAQHNLNSISPGSRVVRHRITWYSSIVSLLGKMKRAGTADTVVVSYGPFTEKKLWETGRRNWHTMTMHNLFLPGIIVSEVLPGMLRRGSGTIVLFGGTGTGTVQGYKRIAAYSAAKTGVGVVAASAAEAVAEYEHEHGKTDVRIICLCPDFVDTEYLTDQQRQRFLGLAGARGLSSAGDYAKFIWGIAHREQSFANGTILDMKTFRLSE